MPAPRLSPELKVIRGSREPDLGPKIEIPQDRALTDLPGPPAWLPNEMSRDEWAKVGGELLKRGLLDTARLTTLGMYCATAGKITQKFQAGDTPSAHLMAQFAKLGRELGIIGQSAKKQESQKPTAGTSRLASIKERAKRAD